jgi:hypothetical protein
VIYISFRPVTWFLIPVRDQEDVQGERPRGALHGGTGFWMLLPIMGIFVWFIKVQGALNRYWESKSASTAPVTT